MRIDTQGFYSLQSLSVSCFHVILGLPDPCFRSTCMSKTVLTAPLEHSTCPYQQSLLSFRKRSRFLMLCRASSSLDLVVTSLAACRCRSVWSLSCHFAADVGGLALSMAKSHWHGALCSTNKNCTCSHLSWNRGGGKRELVAVPWTSSRQFSNMLWLKVHSHRLLPITLIISLSCF